MRLREMLTHNLGWKLVSLLLATLAWTTLRSDPRLRTYSQTAMGRMPLQVYQQLPIRALTAATDDRMFRFDPPVVTVTVRGLPEALQNLSASDVEVFVNVTALTNMMAPGQHIEVAVPAGLSVQRVSPPEVTVSVLSPATNAPPPSTNSTPSS
jgi:hypothetical protein